MTSLDFITIKELRESFAEIKGKKPTQRLMAAINYLEKGDTTMKEVAERYSYTGP